MCIVFYNFINETGEKIMNIQTIILCVCFVYNSLGCEGVLIYFIFTKTNVNLVKFGRKIE